MLEGIEHDSRAIQRVRVPTTFYEADLGVEAILSYEWLTMYNFMINPGLHCMMKKIPGTGGILHFAGNQTRRAEVAAVRRVETPEMRKAQPNRVKKERNACL